MILLLLGACRFGTDGPAVIGRPGFVDTGFGRIDTGFRGDRPVEEALRNPCAVCHNGLNPRGQLNLEIQAWENLVGERSAGNPEMFRVVPGDVEGSYLVHKLRGTHLQVGGTGSQMPPQQYEPLTAAELQRVEDWIRDGAAPF
ncbi:MAG: hypothetical protein R3F61_10545 [Myxococcota bacterium]